MYTFYYSLLWKKDNTLYNLHEFHENNMYKNNLEVHNFYSKMKFPRFSPCELAAEKSTGNSTCCKNRAPPSRSSTISPLVYTKSYVNSCCRHNFAEKIENRNILVEAKIKLCRVDENAK